METTPVQTPLLLSPKGKSTPLVASLFLFTAISEVIMFLSKFHPSDHSDAASEERDALVRIKDSLRKAAVERNLKTALILGVGASGALIGLPWFACLA